MSGAAGPIADFNSHCLRSGTLAATFLPRQGMLCASLTHRGAELLRRVEDIAAAAARGRTAGIPLLHPWANRLASLNYAAVGRSVRLDPASPLLRLDANGWPNHGVPWSRLAWRLIEARHDRIIARLNWDHADLLAVFPYSHQLEYEAALTGDGLTIALTLSAGRDGPVPVSFGFHPYFGIPNVPRAQWRMTLPAMRRLRLDSRMIPTGDDAPFEAIDGPLGQQSFDDGFALLDGSACLSISGGGLTIAVEMLEGYRFAQVYAPRDADLVALEPMTAPANALISGRGLRLVPPGERFRAAFCIRIKSTQ